jgi:hypothetical protein
MIAVPRLINRPIFLFNVRVIPSKIQSTIGCWSSSPIINHTSESACNTCIVIPCYFGPFIIASVVYKCVILFWSYVIFRYLLQQHRTVSHDCVRGCSKNHFLIDQYCYIELENHVLCYKKTYDKETRDSYFQSQQ